MTSPMTDERLADIDIAILLLELMGIEKSIPHAALIALRAEVKRLRAREKDLTEQLFAAGEEIERLREDITEREAYAERFSHRFERLSAGNDALFNSLDEILSYQGGADNALEDEYVIERARTALNTAKEKDTP